MNLGHIKFSSAPFANVLILSSRKLRVCLVVGNGQRGDQTYQDRAWFGQQWYFDGTGAGSPRKRIMMTSSNGNIFRVTGHLCGNSPGTGEFPAQRPVTRSFDFSLICAWINYWVNNREAGDLRRYRAHYDVTLMGTRDREQKQTWSNGSATIMTNRSSLQWSGHRQKNDGHVWPSCSDLNVLIL